MNLTLFDVQNYSNAIFLSPSINYASLFGTQYNSSYLKIPLNKILITVLQCRVKPNSYTVHPNTTFYDANDPYYNNDNIEWRIANPKDIFPCRVLIKIVSIEEFQKKKMIRRNNL